MPSVLTELIGSKKFLITLLLTVVVLIAGYEGVLSKPEVMTTLGVLWPVYLGAQGVADVGAHIADGKVAVEEMYHARQTAKDASLMEILKVGLPLFLEKLPGIVSPLSPLHSSGLLRALAKGDRVVSVVLGPSVSGVCLEDVAEVDPKGPTILVRCSFGGGPAQDYDRMDLVFVPPGVVLPEDPARPAAPAPSPSGAPTPSASPNAKV